MQYRSQEYGKLRHQDLTIAMTSRQHSWGALLLLAGIGLVVLRRRANANKPPLPPSPPPHFLLGNLNDLPSKYEWLAYAKIGKDLQSIFSLWL